MHDIGYNSGMFAYLEGEIKLKRLTWVILLSGGVGYKVYVTPRFLDTLTEGKPAQMYLYTQVREDILALYGFESVDELDLFELLLTVSGIGPKAALGILSASTPENIKESIARQDPTLIASVSGVGKKTAEKVVLELKNKVHSGGGVMTSGPLGSVEVYDALLGLGFKPQEAHQAMVSLPKECKTTEEKLKYCLSGLKK